MEALGGSFQIDGKSSSGTLIHLKVTIGPSA
jgi:hypothetical protein